MPDDKEFDEDDKGFGDESNSQSQDAEGKGNDEPRREAARDNGAGRRKRGGERPSSERERFYRKEGLLFMPLARDLSLRVWETNHYFKHNGMPPEYLIFGLLLSTFYHQFSSRRFDFILLDAMAKGYIKRKPSPNTLLWHLRRPELTTVLQQLLGFSALPFMDRTRGFAVDATRIYTDVLLDDSGMSGRQRYKWLKLHGIYDVFTFVITAARVTSWTTREVECLEPLLRDTVALGFDFKSVTADRGYVSKHNIKVIRELGATPYITFKKNNRLSKKGADVEWDEALERFRRRQGDDFIPHLERNMAETAHRMVKRRFGKAVGAFDETGQINQVLLKVIGHNLCRMIRLHLSF